MTEEEAREWVGHRYSEVAEMLRHLEELVRIEASNQNLIAPSTLASMWSRHIVDSAQLDPIAPAAAASWLDVGAGAGFPGLVIGCLRDTPVVLVEPRKRRAEFLERAAHALGRSNVTVVLDRVERLRTTPFDVISARAVASLDALFAATEHVCSPSTTYVLPKGASGVAEVDGVQPAWQGVFHVEQSVTDPSSVIVVANGVTRACTASR